jgi:HK97 family phage prohead protease
MLHKLTEPDLAKLQVIDDHADAPGGFIEGYASVFNNVDLGGDVVVPGAFTKTLKERLKKGAIKLMDSHKVGEGTAAVIGVVADAKEDDRGLWFRGKLSSVSRAQDIRTKVKEGVLNALSFGYDTVKAMQDPKAGVNYLKELKLYEISVVIWGMNPLAELTAAKSITSLQPFKLAAEDHPWNADEAVARLKAWASDRPAEEWDEIIEAKYGRAFLWSKGDEFALPVADIIDGEPHYVLAGLQSALKEVRDSDKYGASSDTIEASLKALYDQFKFEFPSKGHVIIPKFELLSALTEAANRIKASAMSFEMRQRAQKIREAASR